MKPAQLRFSLLVALLGSVAILVAVSIQPILAQVPTTSATLSPFVGQGTVTPLFTGRTATPAPKFKIPTRQPRPTAYAGPTITPSGPLVAVSKNQQAVGQDVSIDPSSIASLYGTLPKVIGSFQIITYAQNFSGQTASFILKTADGAQYSTELSFHSSAHTAYITYQRLIARMPDGQPVAIGDAASIAGQNRLFIAAMQYRNVSVQILSAAESGSPNTSNVLTEQQLTEVLEAIVKVLQQ